MPRRAARTGPSDLLDQILEGDCLEVLERLPEKSVDLVFADPPYNLQLDRTLHRPDLSRVDGVDAEWDRFDSFADYDAFTRRWLSACRRVLKDSGTLWVIGSYHNIFRVGTALLDLGFWVLNDVQWVKANPMPNFHGTRFTNATETLVWARKSQRQRRYTFNYQAMKSLNDGVQMRNVWELPLCMGDERVRVDGRTAHAAQKPEALLFRVISASSNPGDVVLDPFSGTGTTAAVARRLGRRFIGIEQDPAFVELSRARVAGVTPVGAEDLARAPSRRELPKVPFGALLEQGLLTIGATLTSRDGTRSAVVQADGTLRCADGFVGSIHRAGAHVQGLPACNGWDFWHVQGADGSRAPIQRLREQAQARLRTGTVAAEGDLRA